MTTPDWRTMSGVSEISSDKELLGVCGVYKIIEP